MEVVDVVFSILQFLPPKDVFRYSWISKTFYSAFSRPALMSSILRRLSPPSSSSDHLRLSAVDFPPIWAPVSMPDKPDPAFLAEGAPPMSLHDLVRHLYGAVTADSPRLESNRSPRSFANSVCAAFSWSSRKNVTRKFQVCQYENPMNQLPGFSELACPVESFPGSESLSSVVFLSPLRQSPSTLGDSRLVFRQRRLAEALEQYGNADLVAYGDPSTCPLHAIAATFCFVSDSGCCVSRVDLRNKVVLWKTDCAACMVEHSEYQHRVFLEVFIDVVRVHSVGSYARFVEDLDIRTGRSLARLKEGGESDL